MSGFADNDTEVEEAMMRVDCTRILVALVCLVHAGDVTNAAPARASFTVGTTVTIEPPVGDFLKDLDEREKKEQVRDWAVLGTIARLGATASQAASATYELPPARLPYLDELYSFEYGPGRRAYLGNRVLLFRDSDDPDPIATIGRLADRVKMENGTVPASVETYLIHDDRNEGLIRVERDADVKSSVLFSATYGYVEQTVTDEASLTAFIDQIDDLTFTKKKSNGDLVLGGRRFPNTRTPNITVEDIAALYQAHDELEKESQAEADRLSVDLMLDSMSNNANDPYAYRSWLSTPRVKVPPRGPGFSLDPKWMPDPLQFSTPLMLTRIQDFLADPCKDMEAIAKRADELEKLEPDLSAQTLRTFFAAQVREIVREPAFAKDASLWCKAIKQSVELDLTRLEATISRAPTSTWDSAFARYYQTQATWKASGDPLKETASLVLEYHENETRAQCARYEGIKGTRVGMTLFYTDLVAKYWAIDYAVSAPTLAVPGFITIPQVNLPAAMTGTNLNTRLWFGPRSTNVSRSSRDTFHFEHRFARIYSAGSDPAHPGIESQPEEDSRRSLNWWDRHFEDIANYEPEYHRQNQIMKWSLVTSVLGKNRRMHFLGTMKVKRDYDFASWYRANSTTLRFNKPLVRYPNAPKDGECLPIFISYGFPTGGTIGHMYGGVSTVAKGAVDAMPLIDQSKAFGLRRTLSADLMQSKAGTALRARPLPKVANVKFESYTRAVTRTVREELSLGEPKISYKRSSTTAPLTIKAEGSKGSIGDLALKSDADRVTLTWTDGTIESKRNQHVVSAAQTIAAADKLAHDGDMLGATSTYEQTVSASATSSDDIARLAIVDAAHGRGDQLLAKVQQLASNGKQLSPTALDLLTSALRNQGSESAARYVQRTITEGKPIVANGVSLGLERGQVVMTRDLDVDRTPLPKTPTQLTGRVIYMDDTMRVGQLGLLPDLGGQSARWTNSPNVRIDELDSTAIETLGDRIIDKSHGTSARRVESSVPGANPKLKPVLIWQCDDNQRTQTRSDDC